MQYTFETLKNYALWYYFKYYPSNKKLLGKLVEKSGDENLSKDVFLNIKDLLNEKLIIYNKITVYLQKNKNLNYIKFKLLEKGFDKDLMMGILEESFLQDGVSLLNSKSLYIKIQNYKTAGKSINYIKQKLIERTEDKEIIESIIGEIFPSGEDENILYEVQKLAKKFDKQKVIQKLIQKGFKYDDIKKYI